MPRPIGSPSSSSSMRAARCCRRRPYAASVPGRPSTAIADTLPAQDSRHDVDHSSVVRLLEAVGATVSDSGDTLTITPPSWRPDLKDPYDYVEEVGRLIGFETIEPVVPAAPVGRGLTRSQRARRAINTHPGCTRVRRGAELSVRLDS